jgi:choline dehydrogenase-like flavoprotein
MILDFRNLDHARDIETDVCIVGAGAAGIAIADRIAAKGTRTCLLESGGFELGSATQDLYRGHNIGIPNSPLHTSRLRFFGGSTNHWQGWCTPFSSEDFSQKPWIARTGWPLPANELQPWYESANAWLGLGPAIYDPRIEHEWRERGWRGALPAFDAKRLVPGFWRFCRPPARLGAAWRVAFRDRASLLVLLHANAVALQSDESGRRVRHLEVRALEGGSRRVLARVFVLACGGLENPRLLLASRTPQFPRGVGNQNDWVGRTFMDHIEGDIATVTARDPDGFALSMPNPSEAEPGGVFFRLHPSVQMRMRAGNSAAYLGIARNSPVAAPDEDWMTKALEELSAWLRPAPASRESAVKGSVRGLSFRCFGEQTPNPESRVTLGEERDALGMPRLRLDWRLSQTDRRSLRILGETLAAEVQRLDLGRVRLVPWLAPERDADPDWSEGITGGHHPMGTTRMSEGPEQGVVDSNGRVHGLSNLFVAGSSVFPTSGYANPTLTIVALAQRLASHLDERLRQAKL